MKNIILFVFLFKISILSTNAQQVEYDEYTLNGKTFHNVKIVKTSPAWVSIHHSAGVKSCVPIDSISNDLKKIFHYKQNKATTWHRAYLRAHYNEMLAAQKRDRENKNMERIKDERDRAHNRQLALIRAKQNTNWKTNMYCSRPVCNTPSSRGRNGNTGKTVVIYHR
jgi:hypothetical protein